MSTRSTAGLEPLSLTGEGSGAQAVAELGVAMASGGICGGGGGGGVVPRGGSASAPPSPAASVAHARGLDTLTGSVAGKEIEDESDEDDGGVGSPIGVKILEQSEDDAASGAPAVVVDSGDEGDSGSGEVMFEVRRTISRKRDTQWCV